jgi:hypothetical protein
MIFKIMDEGILITMTYFQRTAFQAVFDLNSGKLDADGYFKQLDYINLDNYLFYMFKMYQIIEV